jgi:hypothetical protein
LHGGDNSDLDARGDQSVFNGGGTDSSSGILKSEFSFVVLP